MDYEVLVKGQIDEGRALIAELTRERNIDVAVALWVKRFEMRHWSFYLGSTALASMNIGDAFHLINLAMGKIRRKAIGLSDIKLELPTEPIAAEAIELRQDHPRNLARWVYDGPSKFSDPSIQTAYIYPDAIGELSRDQVIQTVAALMSRAGALPPSSITLRDGSSFQAVPTSIHRNIPGELQIILHDPAGNTNRTVSADEVVSIH
jgi:hypothetical protein